jgi:hypothetical protein
VYALLVARVSGRTTTDRPTPSTALNWQVSDVRVALLHHTLKTWHRGLGVAEAEEKDEKHG